VRLGTDRPDPENRTFAHNDPIAWTRDHRGQIINALYTILLGNPQCYGAGQTRFKTWWRLVGSAVENAAFEATGVALSFKDMFERVEAEDEDAISRAGILATLQMRSWYISVVEARSICGQPMTAPRGMLSQTRNGRPTRRTEKSAFFRSSGVVGPRHCRRLGPERGDRNHMENGRLADAAHAAGDVEDRSFGKQRALDDGERQRDQHGLSRRVGFDVPEPFVGEEAVGLGYCNRRAGFRVRVIFSLGWVRS
jgi:hypothetical protein